MCKFLLHITPNDFLILYMVKNACLQLLNNMNSNYFFGVVPASLTPSEQHQISQWITNIDEMNELDDTFDSGEDVPRFDLGVEAVRYTFVSAA